MSRLFLIGTAPEYIYLSIFDLSITEQGMIVLAFHSRNRF